MSYVRSIRHELTFDGQTVVVVLKPLEMLDSIRLKNTYKDDGVDAKGNPKQTATDDTLKLFAELLPKYAESVTGINDAAGAAVPVDEIARVAYFFPLVMSCMGRLAMESSLKNPQPSVEG